MGNSNFDWATATSAVAATKIDTSVSYGLTTSNSITSYSGTGCCSIIDVIKTTTDDILTIKKPDVPVETTTKIDIKNGGIVVKYYKDGFYKSEKRVISDIKDVKIHNNVVIVTFADNTTTKAVLDSEDFFNLEQGISICITKKLLGDEGHAIYNKIIRRALKVKDQNEKDALKAKEEKKKTKEKRELAASRRDKKKAKKREEQIEIQKEAYIRAMKSIGKIDCKCGAKKNGNN